MLSFKVIEVSYFKPHSLYSFELRQKSNISNRFFPKLGKTNPILHGKKEKTQTHANRKFVPIFQMVGTIMYKFRFFKLVLCFVRGVIKD